VGSRRDCQAVDSSMTLDSGIDQTLAASLKLLRITTSAFVVRSRSGLLVG
jgi:hypothetical protein